MMKAATASVPLHDWLLKRSGWLDDETTVAVTFAVKTFVAGLLALYVAFWLGLDEPRWALLTVYVVS
jgi:fusaric acid resistance family protein